MQIKFNSLRVGQRAFALMTTLCVLAVALIVFASILSWTFTNSNITQRNNQYNMSENAAESAVERVIGQMDRDFISQSISNSAGAYTTLLPDQGTWPVQYTFSDSNGVQNQLSVNIAPAALITVLNSQYSNLTAQAQQVDVYATATPTGQRYNVPASVHESVQFASIPMFQFAIFYNVNLEVMSAAGLNIYGPVFCNQNIWEGGSLVTFYSTVTAAGTNAPQTDDPFCDYVGTGPSVFRLANQPVSKANPLVMPIGTNNNPGSVMSMLALPPTNYWLGTAAAYTTNGLQYMVNRSDLIVSNFAWGTNTGSLPTGTNFAVYFQDGSLRQLPYDFYVLKSTGKATNYVPPAQYTNISYAGFSWITNVTFKDWREGYNKGNGPAKTVQAVQIDVGLFTTWMNSTATNAGSDASQANPPQPTKSLHSGHNLDSVYIYTSVPFVSGQLPAVRVCDGAQLPSADGFSIATAFPMYVWKDYNVQTPSGSSLGQYGTAGATTYTYPSALLADAITILSDSWRDSSTGLDPTASSTTVNAAMLCGIVQSDPTKTGNVGLNGDYSGGVENFLRLLENWGNATLTYNGSIVVLFPSGYATNVWVQTGNYYSAPTRHFAFDLNFQTPAKIPPLTPQLRALVRGNWYGHN